MSIKEEFHDCVNRFTNLSDLRLYFIKKGKGRKPEHKIFPNFVKLEKITKDQMSQSLLKDLHQKSIDIKTNTSKIRNFNVDDIDYEDYSFLKKGKIAILDHFIEKIRQQSADMPIEDIRNTKDVKNFCVELISSGQSIIIFSAVMYTKIDDSKEIATIMKDQKLKQISEQIVIFSNQIDAIYMSEYETLIIFNETNTEKIFGFNEYFKDLSVKTILGLSELIVTKKEFLEKNLVDKKIIKDIVKLYNGKGFEKTIVNYKEYEKLFKKNKDLDPNLTAIDITADDKLNLDTKNKLKTFVRMTKRDILQDPINNDELYLVFGKQSMKKL